MKARIKVLSHLAEIRAIQVRKMLGRVTYQQNLCVRYRSNIASLSRLSGFSSSTTTPLQRNNHQQYKATLHKMINLQVRELSLAEGNLSRIRAELMQAMRQEQVVVHLIENKMAQWQYALEVQEQKIQDGLASQCWWRNQMF
jgi:flagellar export protein FliJ